MKVYETTNVVRNGRNFEVYDTKNENPRQSREWIVSEWIKVPGGARDTLWVCCRKGREEALKACIAHEPKLLKAPGVCTV